MVNRNTKYWSFTWDTNVRQRHLPKEDQLVRFLNKITTEFVFQKEKGTIKQKEHYQGALTLIGARQSKKQVLQIFEEQFKNVAGLTLNKVYDKVALYAYVTKSEGRVSGPFYGGVNDMYDTTVAGTELRSWQKGLLDFLKFGLGDKVFRDRKIIWVEDQVGNTGKSFFQKYLRIGQRDITVRKLPVSTVDRLISAVTKIVKSDKIDLFMINLTRTQGEEQSFKDLFAAIEDIKDGYIADTMYGKYNECVFESPLIIIFANCSLTDYEQYLSKDRWLPVVIDRDREIRYHDKLDWQPHIPTKEPITLEELADDLGEKRKKV